MAEDSTNPDSGKPAPPAPPTGSVGSTGTTAGNAPTVPSGSGGTTPPKHPTQVPNPNYVAPTGKVKANTWENTKNGKGLGDAYGEIKRAATATLPGLHHQFMTIAGRPLGG